MYDKSDFIIKERKTHRKNNTGTTKYKLYRIICDTCNEPQGYGPTAKKKNYCKRCQYAKLSRKFTKKITTQCVVCGKHIEYTESQYNRAKNHYCSKKCLGASKRKDITDVTRHHLKTKMLQLNIPPECAICGHNNMWNIQAHHKIPVSDGGSNDIDNLEFLCRNCHGDVHFGG